MLPPVRETFVTNASPQKIDGSPLKIVSNAPVVAGKFCENVMPVTYRLPAESRPMSVACSDSDPPRNVLNGSAEPAAFSWEMNASAEPPLNVGSDASADTG